MVSKNVKIFCCDDASLIENYDKAIADTTQVWEVHHRLETHTSDGEARPLNATLSRDELVALGMYYKRPVSELILLTHREHTKLTHTGIKESEEAKRKNSEAQKGKTYSEEYKRHMSEVTKGIPKPEGFREKVSKALKGKPKSEEHRKHLSEALKGRKGPTISEDGKRRCAEAHLGKPKSEETKKKISEKIKGRKWFNNGVIQVQQFECPEGFVPGMLKKNRRK